MRADTHDAELEVTQALIDYDNERIEIRRPPVRTKKVDGSLSPSSAPPTMIPSQRLFFSGVSRDDVREYTIEGRKIRSQNILVGMPDADFQERDTFECWGRIWTIMEMHPDHRWQRKAWVVNFG